MYDAFAEGVRSIVQVCHLVILAPVALTVVALRGRWRAVAGAIVGIVLGGWLFVANAIGNITDAELRISAALTVGVVVVAAFPQLVDRDRPASMRWVARAARSGPAAFIVPAVVATIVAQWWRPCVGVELGAILTDAPGDPFGTLPAAAGFMLGISIPVLLIGFLVTAANPSVETGTRLAWVGTAGCAFIGLSVIAGQHGEIVSRLFTWSQ